MNNKPEFHEDYANRDAKFAPQCTEFDYEQLFARLDGDVKPADIEGLQIALKSVFDWLFSTVTPKTSKRSRRITEQIGRKAIALAWITDPSRFGNDPSLTHLAKSLGIHKAVLSEVTSACSKQFGLRNNHQKHGWNFKPNEKEKQNVANN